MNEEQFEIFYDALINAKVVKSKDFEEKFLKAACLLKKWLDEGNRLYYLAQ